MHCDEERIILAYLNTNEGQYFSPATIARRASPRHFRTEPTWAYPFLTRLFDAKVIECDPGGHYRYVDKEKRRKAQEAERRRKREKW